MPPPAPPQLVLIPAQDLEPQKLRPGPPGAAPLPGMGSLSPGLHPRPLATEVPGHLRRHSLAASAVPRAHGRSWKKGRQRSQSVPTVLCWHRQTSRPSSLGPHSLACPLHLHLGKEHGGGGCLAAGEVPAEKGFITR